MSNAIAPLMGLTRFWRLMVKPGETRYSLPAQAQRSPGKKFSAEVAIDMAVELIFSPEVEWDALEIWRTAVGVI